MKYLISAIIVSFFFIEIAASQVTAKVGDSVIIARFNLRPPPNASGCGILGAFILMKEVYGITFSDSVGYQYAVYFKPKQEKVYTDTLRYSVFCSEYGFGDDLLYSETVPVHAICTKDSIIQLRPEEWSLDYYIDTLTGYYHTLRRDMFLHNMVNDTTTFSEIRTQFETPNLIFADLFVKDTKTTSVVLPPNTYDFPTSVLLGTFKTPIAISQKLTGKLTMRVKNKSVDSIYSIALNVTFMPNTLRDIDTYHTVDYKHYVSYNNVGQPVINVHINKQARISIEVFDILGRHATSLHTGILDAGVHRFQPTLDGGIYFARLQTESSVSSVKILIP